MFADLIGQILAIDPSKPVVTTATTLESSMVNLVKAQKKLKQRHYDKRIARYQPAMEGKGPLKTAEVSARTGVNKFITRQQLELLVRDNLVKRHGGRPARYEWKGMK